MKKIFIFNFLLIFYLVVFFTISKVKAQCPQGTIQLNTQQQIDSFAINYPTCTETLGSLIIEDSSYYGSEITSLDGLNQLAFINGDMVINAYSLPNLVGLENLTSIIGDMRIMQNFSLESLIGLENLTSIGGDMIVLENSFGNWAGFNILAGLESLTSIGGSLTISNNHTTGNLTGLEKLTSVGGSVTVGGNSFYPTFPGDGAFGISSLKGLDSLTTIGGSLNIINNLTLGSFNSLYNLTTIGGNLHIIGNSEEFWPYYVSGVGSLEGLNNLTSIGGNILIKNNRALENVSALEQLTTIGGSLEICGNSHNDFNTGAPKGMSSLTGLDNIDYTTITDLKIYSNKNLSLCGLSNICTYLAAEGTHEIYDNMLYCNSEVEILNTCDGLGSIQLSAFYDINQNKIQDNGEPDYNDAAIPIESTTSAFSQNQLSANAFFGVPDNYTVSYEQGSTQWELITDSMSYFVSLEENETDTVYFGLYPADLVSSILSTIASPPTRCNETITFDISTKNLGTTIASGTLWLEVDENILATNFIDTPDTTVMPNRYGWFFNDLPPSQSIGKQIALQIPGPPDFPVGDNLTIRTYADFEDENGTNTSPIFAYTSEVQCSYDPNDKLVNPTREDNYALFDEDLIYTIRFQNTGNDVAYDVVIQDALDVNFDRESFRILGSSHAERLSTNMSNDGILTFEFRDIFLPDSTSNFEGSQGYVSYLIRTIDGLAEQTPVTNSADIYFDLNPPVITNTVQSVMVSELPTISVQSPENQLDFNIIPNPNPGIFHIQGITNGSYQIFNTMGQVIHSASLNNNAALDISEAASGIYFIEIRDGEQVGTQRFIKQ